MRGSNAQISSTNCVSDALASPFHSRRRDAASKKLNNMIGNPITGYAKSLFRLRSACCTFSYDMPVVKARIKARDLVPTTLRISVLIHTLISFFRV